MGLTRFMQDIHEHLIETALGLSPHLSEAIARIGPIAMPERTGSEFARYLMRAVAGQQLSVNAARSIWQRVETANADLALSQAFCESRIANLRACGLSGAKVKTLIAIAQAYEAGHLDDQALNEVSAMERAASLTQIWGVGQWTADMANIFWFAEQDIWPDGDVTARKTLERLTSRRRKTVRSAQRFAPYRSYLALSLWHIADARPED